jgi:membrane-bound lytic murein transglycosylase B
MIERRRLIAAAAATVSATEAAAHSRHAPQRAAARQRSYASFLAGVRAQATRRGIGSAVLDAALALDQPNARVLELDRHQPEFTLSWAQYRERVLTDEKIQAARSIYRGKQGLLTALWVRYQVDPRVVLGIWGLESNFGGRTGSFGVVDSLATLAFDGRRTAFFSAELMNALRILQNGDVTLGRMLGSYAGAMGQPQFVPSSYLRYAVDYDGDGRRDIWSSEADVLASIANYLVQNGWVPGVPWGQPVSVPPGLDASQSGREAQQPLGTWMRMGVRRLDGSPFSRADVRGALLLPDGPAGDAFMAYTNFDVIRRYNPSDFYSLAVGLLGDSAA